MRKPRAIIIQHLGKRLELFPPDAEECLRLIIQLNKWAAWHLERKPMGKIVKRKKP